MGNAEKPAAPTIEMNPVENDPIMEDREDTAEETSAAHSPAVSGEQGRKNEDDDEERSPPTEEEVGDEDEDLEPVKAADKESVVTEANEADDALSTVKEEPSKEEAEDKATEERAPTAGSGEHTTDGEDLTLDATATTVHEGGCTTPVHASPFCG